MRVGYRLSSKHRAPARLIALVCIIVCTAWVTLGSAQTAPDIAAFGERASFRLNKAAMRARGASQELFDKVGASAFHYFRLLARQFAARTCYEFRDLRWRLPSVAVHGDAHLEQFVVTNETYGLEDFDQAGFGPAVVDLVRYAASLHLACRDARWSCNPDEAVTTYFNAYLAALDHPVMRTQPAVVGRLRGRGTQDRQAWYRWADGLMQPLPRVDEQGLRQGWIRFVELMMQTAPQRPESFYRIARAGTARIGIGSALESKTLIRIAGPSDAPDDDLILEARVATPPAEHECVARPSTGGSLQVLMFTSLLAQHLPEVFGFLPREGAKDAQELWIQSWDPGYRELAVADLQSQIDVNELATDAASQLAGHFWTTFPAPLRDHQRFAQLRAFEMSADRARSLARALAEETVREWERFRQQR